MLLTFVCFCSASRCRYIALHDTQFLKTMEAKREMLSKPDQYRLIASEEPPLPEASWAIFERLGQ